MVKIISFKERLSNEGKPFMALLLQGGVEIIHSATGKMYATAKKASIATTFDEATCQALVGTDLPGSIEKHECEQYSYTVEKTGEILQLNYRYVFVPEPKEIQIPYRELTDADFPELAAM